MTDDELRTAQAAIATLETEIAALTQLSEECILRSREFNAKQKDAVNRRTSLVAALRKAEELVRNETTARAIEAKRIASEAAKKAADEAAAAKAAEPQQPTELERLRMEVAALRDELKK